MTRTSVTSNLNEPLIFERSAPGKSAYTLPRLDVEDVPGRGDPGLQISADGGSGDFPRSAKWKSFATFTRLSTWNYHIDLGMYPLGSCTMKYNPKLNERVSRIP